MKKTPTAIIKTPKPPKEKKKDKSLQPQIIRNVGPTTEPILKIDAMQEGDIVRGRVYTPEKPKTFNILWTEEEQKRLEELLEIYPDEAIASHRWKKIANALGNRTPKQVASRTQKYFIKLAKQGKPVPGRLPNLEFYINKAKNKKKKENNGNKPHNNNKKRQLDPSYYTPPPVYMSDDEEEITALKLEQMDPELKSTPQYKELVELLQLRQQMELKEKEHSLSTENKEIEKTESAPYFLDYNHEWVSKEPNYLDPSFMSWT